MANLFHGGTKKLNNITLKAFRAHFEVLVKLYDYLKADFELTVWEMEKTFLFFNAISAEHCIVFVQKGYYKIKMDDLVKFFQIYCSINQPLPKLHNYEAAEISEQKEAN